MDILVITNRNDPHVAMVQRYLDDPVIILDPKDYPERTITYHWEPPNFEIWLGEQGLNNVQSVWYRKPLFYEPQEIKTDPLYQRFAHSAYEQAMKAIYSLLSDRLWVSDPWAIFNGNNKLYQIELAHRLGLRVPKTLLTSDPKKTAEFIQGKGNFIVKPLKAESVQLADKTYLMYTTRIPANINLTGLPLAPTIFQEEIPNSCDVRVTVIGNNVFSCEIEKVGTMEGEVDWRKGNLGTDLIYKPCTIPLEEECRTLVKMMGLNFGVIEFVRDYEGQYWFMEINPNGQWGFIEEKTGLHLSKAMADLLANRARSIQHGGE